MCNLENRSLSLFERSFGNTSAVFGELDLNYLGFQTIKPICVISMFSSGSFGVAMQALAGFTQNLILARSVLASMFSSVFLFGVFLRCSDGWSGG
jgi:hypothetical protein